MRRLNGTMQGKRSCYFLIYFFLSFRGFFQLSHKAYHKDLCQLKPREH